MGAATPRVKPHGLKFNEASHRYWLDGKPVPGVTTIIGVLDKSGPLSKWAAGAVAEYVADNPDGVDQLRDMGRGPMVAALKGVPWEKRDQAADRGTRFHDFAERISNGEEVDVPDALVGHVESALRFFDDWSIEPVLTEQAVASREHKYAGKFDLVARYRHPVTGSDGLMIADWKTSKRIYASVAFQLNFYGHAEFYGLAGDEKPLPDGIDLALGVQVRADGYDAHPLPYNASVFDECVTIRRAYDIHKRAEGNWREPGSGYVGLAIHPQEEA